MSLTSRSRSRSHARRLRAIALAVSGGLTPKFAGGGPEPTMTTTAAVIAGRLVEVSGDRSIRHAQSLSIKAVGVAKQSGSAIGDEVAIYTSGIVAMVAKGVINAGDHLVAGSANDGAVQSVAAADPTSLATVSGGLTATRAIVGIAVTGAADTATVYVLLKLG